jgi:hypothetical protein
VYVGGDATGVGVGAATGVGVGAGKGETGVISTGILSIDIKSSRGFAMVMS